MEKITSSELRLGNYVSTSTEICIVKTIGEKSAKLSSINNDFAFESFNESEIESIQLTEEWMIKLGFEKGCNPLGLPMYKHPNHEQCIGQFGDWFGLAGWQYQPPLDYVHQLQNLYFVLMGEELKLKE